jgi:hypothetical protein
MTLTNWESLGSMPPTTWSATCDPYNRWAAQDATSVHPLTATGRITLQNLVFFPLYVEPAVNTGKILAKIRPLQEHCSNGVWRGRNRARHRGDSLNMPTVHKYMRPSHRSPALPPIKLPANSLGNWGFGFSLPGEHWVPHPSTLPATSLGS